MWGGRWGPAIALWRYAVRRVAISRCAQSAPRTFCGVPKEGRRAYANSAAGTPYVNRRAVPQKTTSFPRNVHTASVADDDQIFRRTDFDGIAALDVMLRVGNVQQNL